MQTQTLPTGRSKRSSWHALLLRMQIPGKPHAPYFLFYILAPLCNLPYEAVRHNSLRSFPKWHWPPQRNNRFSLPPRPPYFGRVPVGQRPFLRLPHPFPYPLACIFSGLPKASGTVSCTAGIHIRRAKSAWFAEDTPVFLASGDIRKNKSTTAATAAMFCSHTVFSRMVISPRATGSLSVAAASGFLSGTVRDTSTANDASTVFPLAKVRTARHPNHNKPDRPYRPDKVKIPHCSAHPTSIPLMLPRSYVPVSHNSCCRSRICSPSMALASVSEQSYASTYERTNNPSSAFKRSLNPTVRIGGKNRFSSSTYLAGALQVTNPPICGTTTRS